MESIRWAFALATLSALLWAMCNYLDKIVLEKYFKVGGVGTLLIFSALSSVAVLPLLWYLSGGSVFAVSTHDLGILTVVAILNIVLLWMYFMAIKLDDPSRVVIFYQLVPVFGIVSGWLFLNEVISSEHLIAMFIIIVGTSIIAFEKVGGSLRFKGKTVGFMLVACVCWATELALFKMVTAKEDVFHSLFLQHVVLMVLGAGMLIFLPQSRKNFLTAMRENSVPILAMNLFNEALYMLGTILYGVAVMSAPVALVLLTETFQSIFIFIIAVLIAKFAPRIAIEGIEKNHMIRKVVAICITAAGTLYLCTTGIETFSLLAP